ncbi:CDP-alcohol phosphatidyltransferase [Colletotrichum graminicola]|uniref:CDP-alcohol phosphatidyltransferase n=1 Tax=Colletotrichum graminicola (strain M1.001 / M2 / FGSC 10212) TaxID=645133 RepID=E3QRA3_COLGM|nr:CDP-alcohol phosphatidyltransferase [Colletotrichum graminicola M1.001]EFQ33391.1 CDP-alcohol phosphatidyltransferase [Colletotrichum graminicola M1.001]WDK09613.1 CDP-alcohol phosphatidyltransferase [Colletotrichum graminicola]
MSVRQTRRQAAQAAQAAAGELPDRAAAGDEPVRQVAMNGNGNEATVAEASEHGPKENIFLFWPNIIGYFRIVLAIASLYYMPLHPRTCSLLYSVSCLLDALDGYAARAFEQSTRFGAVLDMVTDRCTTSCLLVFLSCAFPRWTIVFQMLLSLDFSSHYIHMYATLSMAGSDSSHKNIDESRSKILHLYYTNKTVLFVFCALNELFFIALYLLSFSSPLLSPSLLSSVSNKEAMQIQAGAQVNTSLLSQIFPNPYSAAALELARANKMDSTWPWILASISCPVMLIKQGINVIQLVNASKWLAEGDVAARRAKGLPRKKTKST